MEATSQENRCPKCQAPVPAEAPQGLCPKCVLAAVSAPTEAGVPPEARAAPPPLETVAAAFPQLEILGLIGQGGMGLVYKARQPKLDRFVALKLLPLGASADATFTERFNREARLLARLNHPNIVTVHDFGQSGGFFYLMMEFVDGVNLRQAMRAGRFSPAEALALVPKICEALQFAHDEGVLHRDIKPENILLDTRGRVKIADFGIAKLMGGPAKDVSLTASGAVVGTPHYMAPEQLERPQDVDHRADIYSLGVVFYEMLTGELPIGRFAPPSQKTPMDSRVDEVVLRALEKERERRFQSAGEVKTQVEHIATTAEPAASRNPARPSGVATPPPIPVPVWVKRAGILFTVLGLIEFVPTVMSFGEQVKVWNMGSLLVLTGIALLTRNPRWRKAALIGNTIALTFAIIGATLFLVVALKGTPPPGWTISLAGVPNSTVPAVLLGLVECSAFVAGLWLLCRPDVKALFGASREARSDDLRTTDPTAPPAAVSAIGSSKTGTPRWSGRAVAGSVLVAFSLVIAVPLTLGWLFTASYVLLATPGQETEAAAPVTRVMVAGLPLLLALVPALSGTLLGAAALSAIRRGAGKVRGLVLALFAALWWPVLLLDALLFIGVSSIVRGIGATLDATTLVLYLTLSTLITFAVGAMAAARLWRWVTTKPSS